MRIVADDPGKIEKVCEALHVFPINNPRCSMVRRLDEKTVEKLKRGLWTTWAPSLGIVRP